MATTIDVLILMGSDSDAAVMSAAGEALTEFGLTWEMTVASAHRSPARVMRLIDEAPGRGAWTARRCLERRGPRGRAAGRAHRA